MPLNLTTSSLLSLLLRVSYIKNKKNNLKMKHESKIEKLINSEYFSHIVNKDGCIVKEFNSGCWWVKTLSTITKYILVIYSFNLLTTLNCRTRTDACLH